MAKNVMDLIASLEEEDVQVDVAAGDGNLDVVETIEEDGEIAEAADLQDTTDQVADGIAETSDSVEAVDAQVEANEKTLENPEAASDEQVAAQVEASQEALNDALFLMGGKRFRNQNRVSLEGIETNIEKLRYATEGLKDFAKNAWEKIKELFTKFITFFKRLSIKIGAWFDQGEKKAKGLIKRVNDLANITRVEIDPDAQDKIASKLITIVLLTQIRSELSTRAVGLAVQKLKAGEDLLPKIDLKKIKDNNLTPSTSYDALAKFTGFSPDLDTEEGEKGFAAYVVGNKVHYLSTFGNVEVEAYEESDLNIKQYYIIKSDLLKLLEHVQTVAKGYSKTVNSTFKSLDKALKDLDKEKGQDLKGSDYEDKVDIRKDYLRTYKVLTKAAMLDLKEKQSFISGTLSLGSVYLSLAKGRGGAKNARKIEPLIP